MQPMEIRPFESLGWAKQQTDYVRAEGPSVISALVFDDQAVTLRPVGDETAILGIRS